MCHSDVVQVLKDCASNKSATIIVERLSFAKNKNNDFSKMGLYRVKTPTENCPLLMESTNSQKLSDCSSNSLKRNADVYGLNNNNLQACYSRSQSPGNELDLDDDSWNRKRSPDSNYMTMSRSNNFYNQEDFNSSRTPNNNEGYFYPVPNGSRKESTSFENEQPLPMNNDLR